MAAIEDLPEDMQRHVVGMPRDWVRTFRRVANAIVMIRGIRYAGYDYGHLSPNFVYFLDNICTLETFL